MEFIADLHIHSYLSRATAKNLNLEHINLWAQLKGITVVGTGDFTHPQWFQESRERLEPAEDGLFKLKPEFAQQTAHMVPTSCRSQVRFILSVEISSIYKKNGKTRKVHNVVLAPSLEAVEKISQRLGRIGNISSDGRPILGLDCRSLLEIVLEASEDAVLIPAHIWTPWFSVLGSRSGFDSLEECFEDLTSQIFAVETGLSSDPAMNWMVSSLDGLTLVSNSDAHSPANLGREANVFDTDLSYFAIRDALRTGDPMRFLGTLEYFAEEGKYHFDGHRKCGVRFSPHDTVQNRGLCPVCGRPVTIGVMYRVEELADRKAGAKPDGAHPYTNLLPLTDILSEVFQVGPKSKKVAGAYQEVLERLGPEFEILRNTPLEALERHGPPLFAEAIRRMRNNRVRIAPGYDGEFGAICLFQGQERDRLLGQKRLFAASNKGSTRKRNRQAHTAKTHVAKRGTTNMPPQFRLFDRNLPEASQQVSEPTKSMDTAMSAKDKGMVDLLRHLNEAQRKAVKHCGGPLLIVAGPGTGKTSTIAHRIAYLLMKGDARPEQVLAVTFTNKAAKEMAERLGKTIGDREAVDSLTIKTFHALCLEIISHEAETMKKMGPVSVLNEGDRRDMVKRAMKQAGCKPSNLKGDSERIMSLISFVKQLMLSCEDDPAATLGKPLPNRFSDIYRAYEEALSRDRLLDFDDLIFKTVRFFETNDAARTKYRKRFSSISVDEYQDINYAQYRLIRLLAPPTHDICVIGDPDQAIYGFRGADVQYFHRFCDDYPTARTIRLNRNYRSTETILRASGQVMGDGRPHREEKGIWSGIHGAKALTVAGPATERAEAEYIIKTIEQDVGGISHFSMESARAGSARDKKERSFSDFAVLYRVNEQAKALKEAFARSGIPFQSVGEEKLENRKGIRELISYLKVGLSFASDLDVERIVNFPSRRISRGVVEALRKWSEMTGEPLFAALGRAGEISVLSPQARNKVMAFSKDLNVLKERIKGRSVYEQIQLIFDQFKIMDEMSGDRGFEEDLGMLFTVSRTFSARSIEFLSHLSLENEQDLYDPVAEKVAVMTMHASKGLEFPVVFIAGCEDGLIPFRKKNGDEADIIEEKRLFYVAITRAKEKVFLTHARQRLWFGQKRTQRVSPFLESIEEDLKQYKRPFSAKPTPKRQDRQLSLFEL
ncbi:MAG: UvrD-helicase domain-containing protein [Desulfobacterales bacterium]|nr:UvrD-helicase domain-containing protein [Desulfobacterales bacterium]